MLTQEQINKFETDGYLIIPDFLTLETCKTLKHESDVLLDTNTTNTTSTVFANDLDSYQYMFESEHAIHYFLDSDKKHVNKLGHAVHTNAQFHSITFSKTIKDISLKLGFKEPIVLQSMIIFKFPGSEELGSHRDETFLYTEPSKTLGFWIALEDVHEDNSCLQFVPGSHLTNTNPIRWVREETGDGQVTMKFVKSNNQNSISGLPVKATCPKGSLILIHGQVVHKSAGNASDKSRYAYTFHIVETQNTRFPETNWMTAKGAEKL